jgi:hypothetical protein
MAMMELSPMNGGAGGGYVFLVTLGQNQADHDFDEGITRDGISGGNLNLSSGWVTA